MILPDMQLILPASKSRFPRISWLKWLFTAEILKDMCRMLLQTGIGYREIRRKYGEGTAKIRTMYYKSTAKMRQKYGKNAAWSCPAKKPDARRCLTFHWAGKTKALLGISYISPVMAIKGNHSRPEEITALHELPSHQLTPFNTARISSLAIWLL